MSAPSATRRILDGESWEAFCETLRGAGKVILREGSPRDPLDRAEGYRYLARLTRGALEQFLECADPRTPVLRRPAHETLKLGADNPDNRYESATIYGEYAYRLRGTRGSVHYLGFGTYAGHYGSGGRRGQTGYLDARELEIGADGRFEITLSCDRSPGNWLPMAPDTATLIVRQSFLDRDTETPARLRLERIGAEGPPPPITPEAVDTGLASAAAWVAGTASLFADWAEGFARHPNQLQRASARRSEG